MYSLKKKAFTLVEMMIIIWITWVLSAVLYPSLNWYLQRGKDVDMQMVMRKYITYVNEYITDNWWFPSKSPAHQANAMESYCMPSLDIDTGCPVSWTWSYTGVDNYIQSRLGGASVFSNIIKYCQSNPTIFPDLFYCSDMWLLVKESYAHMYSRRGYVIPWRSISNNKKNLTIYWYLAGAAPYYSSGWDNYWLSDTVTVMPELANKRCSPGFASWIFSDATWAQTECMYIIEL